MENWIGFILSQEALSTINWVDVVVQEELQTENMNLAENIKFHIVQSIQMIGYVRGVQGIAICHCQPVRKSMQSI